MSRTFPRLTRAEQLFSALSRAISTLTSWSLALWFLLLAACTDESPDACARWCERICSADPTACSDTCEAECEDRRQMDVRS